MVVAWLPQEWAWQAVLLVTGLASLSHKSDGEYLSWTPAHSLWVNGSSLFLVEFEACFYMFYWQHFTLAGWLSCEAICIFFFCHVLFMMSKSYYDLHRGFHENGCSPPPHPSLLPPSLLRPPFMFWIVWRWTASCLLPRMPTVSRCPVRVWRACRVDRLPPSGRWHDLCICSLTDIWNVIFFSCRLHKFCTFIGYSKKNILLVTWWL